ncbi:MAG: phosphate transport system substrate-binding protein [Thermotogota bacterium]|nr:phosphate transport system substrate-binding protein [Thermotogota bacterium]MDK2864770.1 phosphate transport system substrate-binding protein [Thermotogota bacterium]
MRKIAFLILALFVVVNLVAETLVIKGSNTILPIAQKWVEAFKRYYPDLVVTLEGAGSSTGIKALFNNTADIANASRFLKPSEIEQMHEQGRYFVPIVIGYDGIAVIVNKSLPIDSIDRETLKKIYTGKVSTWNQIDPSLPKKRIAVYSRNTASGTFETWESKVLEGERMAPWVQMLESTQAEIEAIKRNPYAIGYVGFGYVTDEVKVLKVEGVAPEIGTILSGEYPISRPLFVFFDLSRFENTWPESGVVARYIRFIVSPEGQKLVKEAGYVPAYSISE